MLVGALSTDHKIGLAVVGATFVLFALVSAFLIPRYRPQYPGRQGLPVFLLLSLALFVGMMSAVIFFGREAKGGEKASTSETTGGGASAVPVTEVEYKIKLKQKTFRPGRYRFELKNDGTQPHNLTVKGPGVSKAATPTINGGKTASLDVALRKGTYELYCSVPGHKQAGMDLKIKVG